MQNCVHVSILNLKKLMRNFFQLHILFRTSLPKSPSLSSYSTSCQCRCSEDIHDVIFPSVLWLASDSLPHIQLHICEGHTHPYSTSHFSVLQLLPADAEPPQSPPCTGVYISGLHLHHASWDADRCVLTDQQSFCEKKTPRSKIPTVWLRPVDELILEEERAKKKNDSSDDNSTFSCPVFTTSDPPICGCNPVIDVNLPAKEPALWAERRVYMSTTP